MTIGVGWKDVSIVSGEITTTVFILMYLVFMYFTLQCKQDQRASLLPVGRKYSINYNGLFVEVRGVGRGKE